MFLRSAGSARLRRSICQPAKAAGLSPIHCLSGHDLLGMIPQALFRCLVQVLEADVALIAPNPHKVAPLAAFLDPVLFPRVNELTHSVIAYGVVIRQASACLVPFLGVVGGLAHHQAAASLPTFWTSARIAPKSIFAGPVATSGALAAVGRPSSDSTSTCRPRSMFFQYSGTSGSVTPYRLSALARKASRHPAGSLAWAFLGAEAVDLGGCQSPFRASRK